MIYNEKNHKLIIPGAHRGKSAKLHQSH